MARTGLPRQGGQEGVASTGLLKRHGQNRRRVQPDRQAEQDRQTGKVELDRQNRTSRARLPGQDC